MNAQSSSYPKSKPSKKNNPHDREAAEAEQSTGDLTIAKRAICSQFLGEQDINAIIRGEVVISPGDTFTLESVQATGGVAAYAYEPGCRQGKGEWNNFRLLYSGLRTKAIAAATAFATDPLSGPPDWFNDL